MRCDAVVVVARIDARAVDAVVVAAVVVVVEDRAEHRTRRVRIATVHAGEIAPPNARTRHRDARASDVQDEEARDRRARGDGDVG